MRTTAHLCIYTCVLTFVCGVGIVHAEPVLEYAPLIGIPQLEQASGKGLVDYFNSIYLLTIAIGALLAVVKMMIAGVKYSFSDIVTSKEEAKQDIFGVLLGLAILLIPFIVLNTIYPGLTSLDILKTSEQNTVVLSSSNQTAPSGNQTTPSNTQYERGTIYEKCTLADESACATDCATKKGTLNVTGGTSSCIYKPSADVLDPTKQYPCGVGEVLQKTLVGNYVCKKIPQAWDAEKNCAALTGWTYDPTTKSCNPPFSSSGDYVGA